MAIYKLAFRFDRDDYTAKDRISYNETIKMGLQGIFDRKYIIADRIYTPSRNSIKAVFLSEEELNKVLINKVFRRRLLPQT